MNAIVHPLTVIEQHAPAAPAARVVSSSGIDAANAGKQLVEMFADETGEATKVQAIQAMALSLTCGEFTDAVKKAKEIADSIDSLNGFKPAEGAKGSDRYGPKRGVLNARMSEAKQIFGVAKQAPDVLRELGYWPAVNTARKWLGDHGKTWDGNKAETADEKRTRKAQATEAAAMTQVMLANPQALGETRADYLTRIEAAMAEQVGKAQAESFDKRVQTIVESLKKQFGTEKDALLEACNILLTEGQEAILLTENTKQEEETKPAE